MKKILLVLCLVFPAYAERVALCVMATGKYLSYAENLIDSARTYFCTDHEVTYFVFTDGQFKNNFDSSGVCRVYQERLGWPYDTLMRFHAYYKQKDVLRNFDYVYACDADMLFVALVGAEIFSERVATLHPGFVRRRGTYECQNMSSYAYMGPQEGTAYFAGGFYGGSGCEFIRLLEFCIIGVDADLENNYIAVWHDESHLNRFFWDCKPTLVLTPSYCYPEKWHLPYTKKLLALDKDHAALRS